MSCTFGHFLTCSTECHAILLRSQTDLRYNSLIHDLVGRKAENRMREDYSEELCARLCLLTHMAWDDSLPRTFTRAALQTLDENCALDGLVLREPASVPQKTLLRARLLLTRTTGVFEQIQRYEKQGYCGLVRRSSNWPDALHVLRKDEPHFLFVKGNLKLLKKSCVAVAGSRIITKDTAAIFAE